MGLFGSKEQRRFRRDLLETHNEYRTWHGAPKLKLSRKLSRSAKAFARGLAETNKIADMRHSPEAIEGLYGESIACASYQQSGREVSELWYTEMKRYNFETPGYQPRTSHFTAMVWRSTRKVGCGVARAEDGSTYIVARYSPPGNMIEEGEYAENVWPPR
ncbi:Golgi-associated plant pathoproteinsis- protein 1 [Branchiostoma belcheri]|nr:Golgi-associated plant pathoproteinsis- protein 1 [Branchiostoma belcheri]